jgi:hypothetical protein
MRERVLAGVLAMVVSSSLLLAFYNRFWYPPDEGNYAHVAQRVLEGETLNRDVQDIHPGYITFLNAAALRAFGLDLISLRYPLVLAGIAQALVLFLLFPRDRPWAAATAATSLTALGAIQFLNPTAHWYCLALVIGLIACLEPARTGKRWLFVVGVLIGTIALFRQLTGVFAGAGALTYLLWHASEDGVSGSASTLGRAATALMIAVLGLYLFSATDISGIVLFGVFPLLVLGRLLMRPQAPNLEVLRTVSTITLGMFVASLPLVGYHVWHGSLLNWWNDIGPAAVALTRLDFFERTNFGALVFQGLRQAATDGTISGLLNGLYWAMLPALAAANGILVLRLMRRSNAVATAPLPIVAIFYALVSVHFQIPVYLYYSAGLTLSSLLYLTAEMPGVSRIAPVVAASLASIAVVYHAGQPSSRSIESILRGDQPASVAGKPLPHNSLHLDRESTDRYQAILDVICREVPEGGSIFAVPGNAELYFLSQRHNAFRFYNTALGVRDDASLVAVERTLAEHPPKLVTFDPRDKYNTAASLKIMEMVRQRYVFLGRYDPFEVFVLR